MLQLIYLNTYTTFGVFPETFHFKNQIQTSLKEVTLGNHICMTSRQLLYCACIGGRHMSLKSPAVVTIKQHIFNQQIDTHGTVSLVFKVAQVTVQRLARTS